MRSLSPRHGRTSEVGKYQQQNLKISVYDREEDIEAANKDESFHHATSSPRAVASHGREALILTLNFVAAVSCIFTNQTLLKPPVSFKLPISLTLVRFISINDAIHINFNQFPRWAMLVVWQVC